MFMKGHKRSLLCQQLSELGSNGQLLSLINPFFKNLSYFTIYVLYNNTILFTKLIFPYVLLFVMRNKGQRRDLIAIILQHTKIMPFYFDITYLK